MKLIVLFLALVAPGSAGVIFSDNFESGSLSPARWANTGSGVVAVGSPTPGNNALRFALTASGGDVFSVLLPRTTSSYQLDFDFFGTEAADNFLIGFAGIDHQTFAWGLNEQWLWNALGTPAGQWAHVSVTFTPQVSSPFSLKLEAGSVEPGGSPAFEIYFDNISIREIEDAPEPATLALTVGGAVLSALLARRGKSAAR